ncbi:MAG TPA: hypothetical protein VGZ90_07805 [Puia sp.]|jgi:hypothetical protein|nr:hypothetical protein [Puia sp.]
MKSNQKTPVQVKPSISQKTGNPATATAIAIGKKLLEIKRISGAGEMTELNMALFRHLK